MEEEMMEEEEETSCYYLFDDNLDNIYGSWTPSIIIDYETGDSSFYSDIQGHMRFMLGVWYSDSVELRDNEEFNIFYISQGRPCADQSFGSWSIKNDSIQFIFFNQDTAHVTVLEINEDTLIMNDVINFKDSKVIMRRID